MPGPNPAVKMVASTDPNRNRKSVGGQDCSSCPEPLFQAFRLKSSSPGLPRPNTWQSRLINAAADDSVVADLRVDLIGALGIDGGPPSSPWRRLRPWWRLELRVLCRKQARSKSLEEFRAAERSCLVPSNPRGDEPGRIEPAVGLPVIREPRDVPVLDERRVGRPHRRPATDVNHAVGELREHL